MTMIGYLHVSTEQQSDGGHGLSAQRDAITAAGWKDVQWVEDVASGKTMSWVGLAYALHLLDQGQAEGSWPRTWTGSAGLCWTSPRCWPGLRPAGGMSSCSTSVLT